MSRHSMYSFMCVAAGPAGGLRCARSSTAAPVSALSRGCKIIQKASRHRHRHRRRRRRRRFYWRENAASCKTHADSVGEGDKNAAAAVAGRTDNDGFLKLDFFFARLELTKIAFYGPGGLRGACNSAAAPPPAPTAPAPPAAPAAANRPFAGMSGVSGTQQMSTLLILR